MAYLALYRRYRPQTFDEVVGQEYVTRILKNQILHNRIAHAYLLTGIRGTGKTSIAKIFARAVNCPNSADGNPCNTCDVCTQIDKPGISDIIEIDAASNRGVDEIRDIREKVKYPPVKGRYKVYIIDEVHMLTKEAFNALLKTLEEPPAHIIFILATTEPNKLPMTILSRCQRYDIRPIATEEIAERMKSILSDIGVSIEDDALRFIAARGSHSMRDALSLLDQIIDIREGNKPITRDQVLDFLGMADTKVLADVLEAVINRDAASALGAVRTLYASGKNAELLIDQLIETLRDIIVAGISGSGAADVIGCGKAQAEAYAAMANTCGKARLFEMADALIEVRGKMRYSDMAGVILEMSLLSLCVEKTKVPSAPTPPDTGRSQRVKKQKSDVKKPQSPGEGERSLREMMGLPTGKKPEDIKSQQSDNTQINHPIEDETSIIQLFPPDDYIDALNEQNPSAQSPPESQSVKSEKRVHDEQSGQITRSEQTVQSDSSTPSGRFDQDGQSVGDNPLAQTNGANTVNLSKPSDDTAQDKQAARPEQSYPSDKSVRFDSIVQNEHPDEPASSNQSTPVNPDDLYRKLQVSVGSLSKGILYAGALDHCRLAERGGTLVFRADDAALAIAEDMIQDRDFIDIIRKELSYTPTLKTELYTKDYEDMSFSEKTKAILEGHQVAFDSST